MDSSKLKVVETIKTIKELIEFIIDYLSKKNSSLPKLVEEAINSGGIWEYKVCSIYNLEEAIEWFRKSMLKEQKTVGLVFKHKSRSWYLLYHILADSDKKEVILGTDKPFLIVKTKKIEPEFLELFSDKDLLVLK